MRGSRVSASTSTLSGGIIPAHAGLTPNARICDGHTRDHPRACGAHRSLAPMHLFPRGSSPRMRGSRNNHKGLAHLSGIIPAHAGLTASHSAPERTARDHPRACGAHLKRMEATERRMGSSPRMRGSPLALEGLSKAAGIIPAHAGLTLGGTLLRALYRDHPRACGAHPRKRHWRSAAKGSSPRMRGSLLLFESHVAF